MAARPPRPRAPPAPRHRRHRAGRAPAGRRRRPARPGRRVRHAAVRLRRGAPADALPRGGRRPGATGVAYATKAFLCRAMARLAHEEGMCLDVSTGGRAARGAGRRRAGRAAGPARQQQVRGRAGPGASRSGVGRIVVDSFDEIDRLGRLTDEPPPGAPPAGAGAGDPRGRGPHPRVRPHRPGGLQVRLLGGLGRGRRGGGRPASCCPGSSWSASTPTSAARSSTSARFEQAAEVLGGFFAPLGLPELCVGGGLGVAYVNGERAPEPGRVGRGGPGGLRGGRRGPGDPGHRRAGPVDRGRRRHHPLPGRHHQGAARASAPTWPSTAG